jgi:hypothetical protein
LFEDRAGHPGFLVCIVVYARSINGESAAVDETVVEDYVSTTLPNFLRDYDSKNVFNMDETGLFYKLLPNQFTGRLLT